jgi:2',3'-cyclic-nucleotide 2'-phosphodiesterase (5'-nucleotidase family)
MTGVPPLLAQILHTIDRERDRLVAAVVHLNDTYLLDERPEQQLPGFARVTATIRHLREYVRQSVGADRTLVLHSGDFLAPSRVGKETQGRLMVRVLNEMGLDYCTLGNHEFDYEEGPLRERLAEASFGVLLSNVKTTAARLLPMVLWPSPDSPLVALTGVVSASVHRSFSDGWDFLNPVVALRRFAEETPKIPFHIVLTHATREEDRELRRAWPPPRTYLLGGHDHDIHWVEADGAPLLKNLANLQTVRVLLLLAGGAQVWFALDVRHNRESPDLDDDLSSANGPVPDCVPEDVYRRHIDWLLEGISPVDAAIFRRGIPTSPPRLPPEDVAKLADAACVYGPQSVALYGIVQSVIEQLPNLEDEYSFRLYRDDHLPPDPAVEALVANGPARSADEARLVCDLSSATKIPLEARDAALRRAPTDFGVFVAECVRRKAEADAAILNAGTFRADALLPPRLLLRDLRDVFLYDKPRAIVVLDLPHAAVTAALAHGLSKTGNGAFPQTAPDRLPDTDYLRIAISAYLVAHPKTMDGYDRVLAASLGITLDELRRMTSAVTVPAFSVIEAIIAQAPHVMYRPVAVAAVEAGPAERFIEMADRLVALLEKPPEQSPHWSSLRHDEPLDDPAVQRCRDDLRHFLRGLPEVQDVIAAAQRHDTERETGRRSAGLSEFRTRFAASMERLRALHQELRVHIDSFRNGIAYHTILNAVAHGIGGWLA